MSVNDSSSASHLPQGRCEWRDHMTGIVMASYDHTPDLQDFKESLYVQRLVNGNSR